MCSSGTFRFSFRDEGGIKIREPCLGSEVLDADARVRELHERAAAASKALSSLANRHSAAAALSSQARRHVSGKFPDRAAALLEALGKIRAEASGEQRSFAPSLREISLLRESGGVQPEVARMLGWGLTHPSADRAGRRPFAWLFLFWSGYPQATPKSVKIV